MRLSVDVPAGDGWVGELRAGETLRIVDLHGNQAVDTLFFDAHDLANRYSAVDTIRHQGSLYLTTGTVLRSTSGTALLKIVADTCGRHDTLGGACASAVAASCAEDREALAMCLLLRGRGFQSHGHSTK